MNRFIALIGTLALALSLAACACSPTSPGGCCSMCSSGCKAESKPMISCEKQEHSKGCCPKAGADGKSQEGHQH
ncbi:MAG: hypothetical protein HY293_01845 [Planctomycetes bacterium]|nr:hypothetical protein [Planctomycetota bacterium]